MAKHAAPPRRRHSAQKHTSHKGVTLYTLGVLLVAVSVLLSLRFCPAGLSKPNFFIPC